MTALLRISTERMRVWFEREIETQEKAIDDGVAEAALGLRNEMRAASRFAGFGRASKSWNLRPPNKRFPHASLVFTRAPRMMGLAETGGVVRPRNKRFLAIPTKAAGRKANSIKGGPRVRRKVTDFAGKKNIRLVPTSKGGFMVLRQGARQRRGTILFFLVKQTKHPKVLDFEGAAQHWTNKIPGSILRRLPRGEDRS